MSLRKGLSLLLLVAFSLTTFAPVSAAITIGTTLTTSTKLEAYVLPANSTAGAILTQHPAAAAGQNENVKGFSTLATTLIGKTAGNNGTLADVLEDAGKSLYTTFQPAYSGSNQINNVNVVVCETVAAGFHATADEKYFIGLPSGWDINTENGTSATVTPSDIFSATPSNGLSLSTAAAADVQKATAAGQVAGIAFTVNGDTSDTGARSCVTVNIQHENLIAPASGSSPKLTVYKVNGTTANAPIPANGDSATTEHLFAADTDILTQAASVSLATGSEIINDFNRTGDAGNQNWTEKLAAGAIVQSSYTTPSSVTRYRSQAGATDIYGLVVTEEAAGAWASLDANATIVPAKTINFPSNGTGTETSEIVLTCETNGTNAHLTGTAVVTPLTADLNIGTPATANGEVVIPYTKKSTYLGDPNDLVSKFLVQGLQFVDVKGISTSIECLARARRTFENNGDIINEGFGLAEGIVVNGTSTTFVPLGSNDGDAEQAGVPAGLGAWALGAAELFNADNTDGDYRYANAAGTTQNGSEAYFSSYNAAATTISGAAVANGTTALKTITSTTKYGVTVADLPSDSSATGDTDKLVTVTVAQNSLSAGTPVTLSSLTATNDGGINTIEGSADANGGIVLSIRAKEGQTLRLTGQPLSGNTATLDITAEAATITPEFIGTVTSELDGTDGYVKRGKNALLVFTLNNGNTIGFDFDDVVADAKLNGGEIISLGSQKYAAFVNPASSVFEIKVTVDGTALTKAVTITTAFATPGNKSKRHGGMKVADRRAKGKGIVFRPQRRKFLDATRVIEISDDGDVSEALVTLKRKRTRAKIDGETDTDYVCVTSDRQTNCFDLR